MILFAGGHEHIEQAKQYIKNNGLSAENVRLVKTDKDIIVRTKKEGINPWTGNRHLSLNELSLRNLL